MQRTWDFFWPLNVDDKYIWWNKPGYKRLIKTLNFLYRGIEVLCRFYGALCGLYGVIPIGQLPPIKITRIATTRRLLILAPDIFTITKSHSSIWSPFSNTKFIALVCVTLTILMYFQSYPFWVDIYLFF